MPCCVRYLLFRFQSLCLSYSRFAKPCFKLCTWTLSDYNYFCCRHITLALKCASTVGVRIYYKDDFCTLSISIIHVWVTFGSSLSSVLTLITLERLLEIWIKLIHRIFSIALSLLVVDDKIALKLVWLYSSSCDSTNI